MLTPFAVPQVTNRRVNALENVLIPKFENTVKCASATLPAI